MKNGRDLSLNLVSSMETLNCLHYPYWPFFFSSPSNIQKNPFRQSLIRGRTQHKNIVQNSHLPNLPEPVVLQQCDTSFIQVNVPKAKSHHIIENITTILKSLTEISKEKC